MCVVHFIRSIHGNHIFRRVEPAGAKLGDDGLKKSAREWTRVGEKVARMRRPFSRSSSFNRKKKRSKRPLRGEGKRSFWRKHILDIP